MLQRCDRLLPGLTGAQPITTQERKWHLHLQHVARGKRRMQAPPPAECEGVQIMHRFHGRSCPRASQSFCRLAQQGMRQRQSVVLQQMVAIRDNTASAEQVGQHQTGDRRLQRVALGRIAFTPTVRIEAEQAQAFGEDHGDISGCGEPWRPGAA